MIPTTDFSLIDENVLSAEVQVSNPLYEELMEFTWRCIGFTDTKMELQLSFENWEQVSLDFQNPDIFTLTVIDPSFFRSSRSFLTVLNETIIDFDLPEQVSDERARELEMIESSAELV